jgi:hypothetical protein
MPDIADAAAPLLRLSPAAPCHALIAYFAAFSDAADAAAAFSHAIDFMPFPFARWFHDIDASLRHASLLSELRHAVSDCLICFAYFIAAID